MVLRFQLPKDKSAIIVDNSMELVIEYLDIYGQTQDWSDPNKLQGVERKFFGASSCYEIEFCHTVTPRKSDKFKAEFAIKLERVKDKSELDSLHLYSLKRSLS